MEYKSYSYPSTKAEVSVFEGEGGMNEYQVMIHVTDPMLTYDKQMNAVLEACSCLLTKELQGAVAVFKRFFLSDAANQAKLLYAAVGEKPDCALSVVEQPPLDGSKIALWAYLQTSVETKILPCGLYEVKHGAYRQLWLGGSYNREGDAEHQMQKLLSDYALQLEKQGCALADNCLRTWIFVQDIDCNYSGMVKARNEVFATRNMTKKTHSIASTGIGGRHADPQVSVMADALAVEGVKPEQIRYLYAPTHLNPTHEYGVSFERGTAVDYDDRRQVFISGTASINNRGEVMYAGDIRRQAERMWENVETLLKEADCGFEDVSQIIVYLRDVADYAVVKHLFDERFSDIPKVITLAPVCRQGWLVEMECMAVKKKVE